MKKRLLNILFWSIISAAFIGPGTITTASKAGALFGFDLLWALVFSTFACLILQEGVARLTIFSGKNLGQAINLYFKERSIKILVLFLVVGAIIIGSAAYETGNILGAVAGLNVLINIKGYILVLLTGILAVAALNLPSVKKIAHLLGFIVVIMGISFFTTAILLGPDIASMIKGGIVPKLPEGSGSGILVLGLIGTTVVPYNLFLGSGVVTKDHKIGEMRFGLSIAILLGGLISMSVLVVGSFITSEFSFEALIFTLRSKLGSWAGIIFGIGMFSAGLSSAITAPLASSLTAKSLFGEKHPKKWEYSSFNYKFIWGIVLLTGIVLGMIGFKPIPAIIIAQALNGLILPFIAIFLILVINDPKVMGKEKLNGLFSNIMMMAVVWVTLVLGIMNIFKAIKKIFPRLIPLGDISLFLNLIFSTIIWSFILILLFRNRKKF